MTAKCGLKKVETSFYGVVYLELFRHDSQVWNWGRQTDIPIANGVHNYTAMPVILIDNFRN